MVHIGPEVQTQAHDTTIVSIIQWDEYGIVDLGARRKTPAVFELAESEVVRHFVNQTLNIGSAFRNPNPRPLPNRAG